MACILLLIRIIPLHIFPSTSAWYAASPTAPYKPPLPPPPPPPPPALISSWLFPIALRASRAPRKALYIYSTYTHTYTHTHTYIYFRTYIHIHIYLYLYIHIPSPLVAHVAWMYQVRRPSACWCVSWVILSTSSKSSTLTKQSFYAHYYIIIMISACWRVSWVILSTSSKIIIMIHWQHFNTNNKNK